MARFLSQHGFSCAAVQEEQLRLCIQSFQLNPGPLSDTISAPAGAQLSSVSASLGAFSFQAEKQATQTNGCHLSCSDRPRSRLAAARQQFRSPTPPKHSSSLHHHYLAYLRALVKCLQFRRCGPPAFPGKSHRKASGWLPVPTRGALAAPLDLHTRSLQDLCARDL